MHGADPGRARGFARLLVLGVAMALAILLAGVMASQRDDSLIARQRADRAVAVAAADGAIAAAVMQLLAPQRPACDGTPWQTGFDGHAVTLAVQDQSGLVDINAAGAGLLRRVFALALGDDARAAALAGAVIAYRQGRGSFAFAGVGDLQALPGIDAASLARLRPALTVYSQAEGVNTALAPLPVLLALPGMTDAEAARILQARSAGDDDLTGHALAVAATLTVGHAQVTRTAMVRLTGDGTRPVWIMEWR